MMYDPAEQYQLSSGEEDDEKLPNKYEDESKPGTEEHEHDIL